MDLSKIDKFDLLNLELKFDWLKELLQKNHEHIYLSTELLKSNRFGVKSKRVIFITDKAFYNYNQQQPDKSKQIPFSEVNGLTISYYDHNKSDEFLIHMRNGVDHRYHGGKMRDTIVALISAGVKAFQSSDEDDLILYKVGSTSLKTYQTSKVDA